MPGAVCSAYGPSDTTVEPKWQRSLALVTYRPEHVLEQYNEPGFLLACIYHPEVCQGPRIRATENFMLAYYGNIYEDGWAQVADGEALCQVLLDALSSSTGNAATPQRSRKASNTTSRPSHHFWTGTSLISAHAFRSVFSTTSCSTNA